MLDYVSRPGPRVWYYAKPGRLVTGDIGDIGHGGQYHDGVKTFEDACALLEQLGIRVVEWVVEDRRGGSRLHTGYLR